MQMKHYHIISKRIASNLLYIIKHIEFNKIGLALNYFSSLTKFYDVILVK